MRLHTLPVLLIAAMPWTVSAAVDPGMLDLVPPQAKVLSGVHVEQALRSSFGQFAAAMIPPNEGLAKFVEATGFDFRRDLREILVATGGLGFSSGADTSMILLRGSFQPAKIAAVAALTGATSTSYAGIPILTPQSGKQPVSGAFIDAETLVFGTSEAIKDAIDRRAAGIHATGALAQKAISTSGMFDLWSVTAEPLSSFDIPALGSVPASALSSILGTSAGIQFDAAGANVTCEAVTRTAQDALTVASLGQLLLAMAQTTNAPSAQAGAALLQSAHISADGTAVRFTLSIPEQQLEQMLASRPAARKVALPAR